MSIITGGIYNDLIHSNGPLVWSAVTASTIFLIESTDDISGPHTFIMPYNLIYVSIDGIGGGGSGGLTNSYTINGGFGGGGGGGYALKTVYNLTPGASYTYYVGTGGTGTQGSNRAGGDTVFGSNLIVAKGGQGGGVNNATAGIGGGGGGAGGTNIGDVTYAGGNGGVGVLGTAPQTGGGGGAASNSSGGTAGGTAGGSGIGGAAGIGAYFAGGNGASGAAYTTSPVAVWSYGIDAPIQSGDDGRWGGGGSGGYNRLSASAVQGGDGRKGSIWIYGASAYTYWTYVRV